VSLQAPERGGGYGSISAPRCDAAEDRTVCADGGEPAEGGASVTDLDDVRDEIGFTLGNFTKFLTYLSGSPDNPECCWDWAAFYHQAAVLDLGEGT
jgi:hypothetical protein